MYLPVRDVFGSAISLRLVRYQSGSKSRISRYESSEEYSHVISFKGPPCPCFIHAAGNDCCPVYVCHLRRSSGPGPACSKVRALRRILLLSSRRVCAWPASRLSAPLEQPPRSEPPRLWRHCYLQFQPLAGSLVRWQRSL